MAKGKYKLWFSQKQEDDRAKNNPGKEITFGILEDGSIVEYTEAILVDSSSPCNWDDATLLGIGDYHHSEKRS